MSIRCTLPDGLTCEVRPGETLLDACRRTAVPIPFSCGSGICQTCLLRAKEGTVGAEAQAGLDARLRQRHYLLACRCHPVEPLVLAWPDPEDRQVEAVLYEAQRSGDFLHVRVETTRDLLCRAGSQLALCTDPDGERLPLQVTWSDPAGCMLEGLVRADHAACGDLVQAPFGSPCWVRGPRPDLEQDSRDEAAAPAPDPALWAELGRGDVVRRVLEDFYRRVYAAPLLAPFFEGVTLDRSIDKQYSFLRQLMTGERVYFGDRPRNAHHWMVISQELFDHRQELMERVLAEHGLSTPQIARWTRLELHYRPDIVKSHAWPRVVNGQALPADGYAREILAEATLCDHCGEAVEAGVSVAYHVRLGTVSCPACGGGTSDGVA